MEYHSWNQNRILTKLFLLNIAFITWYTSSFTKYVAFLYRSQWFNKTTYVYVGKCHGYKKIATQNAYSAQFWFAIGAL